MNVELADYLIGLDKYIVQNGDRASTFLIVIEDNMDILLKLSVPDNPEQNLLIEIWESKKKSLKISLHHQDESTKSGLLRLDFNGRHRNPVEIMDTVPEKFKPFAGQYLDDYAGHMHYVVDDYKPLAWAIPLESDDFPVKKMNDRGDYTNILKAFFKKINLKTIINYNFQMSML